MLNVATFAILSYALSDNINNAWNIDLVENRWVNNTKYTIWWGSPRYSDQTFGGKTTCDSYNNCLILCRNGDQIWKDFCSLHEMCHERQYKKYYANPPKNQLYLSDRYIRENKWEEECYNISGVPRGEMY